jgi:lipoprotein-anchoring transpeptidase ErfK/SrfK
MSNPNPVRPSVARFVVAAALAALASGAAAATPDHPGAAPRGAVPAAAPAAEDASAAPLRIVVNIPAYRLDAFAGDELVATFPVTVGKPSEPTFEGRFEISSVIWNPWWHPPANRQPREKVTPPGPRNPMGRVKLPLRGLYYIHGTPKEEEIGRPTSRGCVRMRNEDVLTLTRLVHDYAGPLPTEELARLEGNPRATKRVPLARPVPVQIVYQVAEVRDGALAVYRDIYSEVRRPLAEVALEALAAAGVATDGVDATWLAELTTAERLKEAPLVMAVETLLQGAPVEDAIVVASTDAGAAAAAVPVEPTQAAVGGAGRSGGHRRR